MKDGWMDAVGARFGRLVVESETTLVSGVARRVVYVCACDCGNKTRVWRDNLISGQSKSCGCLASEKRRGRPARLPKPSDMDYFDDMNY